MGFLSRVDGQPTTLQAGNAIYFDAEHNCLMLSSSYGDGHSIRWSGGDDKMEALFIKDEHDFFRFVYILAQTHGLSVRQCEGSVPYPAYVFV